MIIILVAAVVIARNLVALSNKGRPGAFVLIFCITMSVMYALFFFSKIPANNAELFSGESLIRIPSALLIFLWSFSEFYITHDYCLTMAVLPVMIFCASDVRFMPLNVIAGLALTVFGYETVGFDAIPWSLAVSFVLVAPKLKEAETWKKLVFAATQICTAALLIYNIYQLRFNFSLQTAKSYLLTTVIMILFAAFFIVCAVLSLRSKKASPARKKKKAVEGKKPEYLAAFGYTVAAVFALLSTMHESRIVMGAMVGVLMSLLMLCKDSTCVQLLTDKAAGAVGGLVNRISASETAE